MKSKNVYFGPASKPMSLSEYQIRRKSRHCIFHAMLPARSRYGMKWEAWKHTLQRRVACWCSDLFIRSFYVEKEIKFCSASHTLWSYKLRFVVFRHTSNL